MSGTPETLADIAAEIRHGERMFWSLRDCAAYADRIEAAAERDRVSAHGNAAGAPAAESLSAVLAETRKSLADDSWIDEITALDEDGEPDDFARRVVPLESALEAIDRIKAAAEEGGRP